MKTSWVFTSILAVAFAMRVCADEGVVPQFDENVTQERLLANEASPAPQQPSKPMAPAVQNKMYMTALPDFQEEWGFFPFGEYLYWKAEEGGLEYGFQTPDFSGNRPFGADNGRKGAFGSPSTIHPDYSNGFRVGFDVTIPYDGWDVLFGWTSYTTSAKSEVKNKISSVTGKYEIVYPMFLNPNYVPRPTGASAHWSLDYNVLDINLGRDFYIGKHLSVRPFAGFKAAWIHQRLIVDYGNIFLLTNSSYSWLPGTIKSTNINNVNGYGIAMGADTRWPIIYGLSFVGDVSVSLLWAKWKVRQNETNPNGTPRSHLSDGSLAISPAIEMFGGLAWEKEFRKWGIALFAGWEQQLWFAQNQLNVYLGNSILGNNVASSLGLQGNLSLFGLTLGAVIGF